MQKQSAKNLIRKDAEKAPLVHMIIVTLFAVGLTMLPVHYLFGLFIKDSVSLELLSQSVIRIVLSVVGIVYIFKYGFQRLFKGYFGVLSLVMALPALLVAVNNAPIIALANGQMQVVATPSQTALYFLFCLSVGVFEEVIFRGIIFPLSLMATKKTKFNVFWAVALSSCVFAVVHVVNLFSGSSVGAVALQVGYTFLIGAMCAISLCITGNLFVCILLHTVYDLGGMLITAKIAVGYQWNTPTIIITAVLGIIVCGYMLFIALSSKPERVNRLIYTDESVNEQAKS